MPRQTFLRTVSWTLLVAVLLMFGVTTGNAVAHELQHAMHHSAGMHSTGICAWMCAAAGASVTAPVALSHTMLIHHLSVVPAGSLHLVETLSLLRSRAPPSLG